MHYGKYARADDNPSAVIELLEAIIPHDEPSDALVRLAEAHASESPRKRRNKIFFDSLPQHIRRLPLYASQYANYLLNAGVSGVDERSLS